MHIRNEEDMNATAEEQQRVSDAARAIVEAHVRTDANPGLLAMSLLASLSAYGAQRVGPITTSRALSVLLRSTEEIAPLLTLGRALGATTAEKDAELRAAHLAAREAASAAASGTKH